VRTAAVAGTAAAGILVYDVMWPLVYRGVPGLRPILDVVLTIAAFVIPFVIGVVLGRSEAPGRASVLTAGVGAVDSTLGWAISRWIGPGRRDLGDESSAVIQIMLTIVAVVAIYGVFGLAGAVTGRRWNRHRSARAGR